MRDRPERSTGKVYHDRPADTLLHRLDAVRQTGPDRWIARCPAHEDRHPSLSIRETGDSTLLVHCWAGCTALDIVAAVGLELRDLFPPPDPAPGTRQRPPRRPWAAIDVLRCLVTEAAVVQLAAADLARGRALDDTDRERLATAARRLATALDLVEGSR